MALHAVSARTARNLRALNDHPFVHALCDFRKSLDKNRITAEFTKTIKPLFADYTQRVFVTQARPGTAPYGILLDTLQFADQESELYKTISPQLLVSPSVWRDAATRIQNTWLLLTALEPLLCAWQLLSTK